MSDFARLLAAVFAALPAAAFACEGLVVDAGWVRETPPGVDVAAGYMRLSNRGSAPITLDGFAATCCGQVMLHRSERHGDDMRMVHQDHLAIAPGASVILAPGGLHLMLMGLAAPLEAGAKVDIVLRCQGRETRTTLPVRADAP